MMATGARVSNAYPTCRIKGNRLAKVRLMPRVVQMMHVVWIRGLSRYAMGMRPISWLAG